MIPKITTGVGGSEAHRPQKISVGLEAHRPTYPSCYFVVHPETEIWEVNIQKRLFPLISEFVLYYYVKNKGIATDLQSAIAHDLLRWLLLNRYLTQVLRIKSSSLGLQLVNWIVIKTHIAFQQGCLLQNHSFLWCTAFVFLEPLFTAIRVVV